MTIDGLTMENGGSNEVSLAELDFPKYVKNLMILDALGKTPEDAKTTIQRIDEGTGEVVSVPATRTPLLAIIYPDMNAAYDAVLSAMGYETE